MADKMFLVVTARKEVPDRDAGKTIYDLIKARMSDRPDVQLQGHVTNHFDLDQEPT